MKEKQNLNEKIEKINELIMDSSDNFKHNMFENFSLIEKVITILMIIQLLFIILNGIFTIFIFENNVFL